MPKEYLCNLFLGRDASLRGQNSNRPVRDTAASVPRLEAKELPGIFQKDLLFYFGPHLNLFKISQPPPRGHVGMIRAEKAFVLQESVGILDKGRGKIFRGPAGKVDVDIGLMHGHGQHLLLPGQAG